MLYQMSNITILILAIWLSYITTQNSGQLDKLQSKIANQEQQHTDFQINSAEKLNTMAEFINKQQQAEQQLKQAQVSLEQHKQQTVFAKTYRNLLTAELLQKEGKFPEAAALLKASKDNIWMTGDKHPSHKEKLQGLMQPIDEVLQAWEGGNSKSIQTIYQTVGSTLQATTGGE